MTEPRPSYYERYLALGEKEKEMDFFLGLFEGFNEREWENFLMDLLLEKSYPEEMMKYRKEFSTLAYYAGILSSLSNIVKKDIEKALLKIAWPVLRNRTGEAEKILLRQLELSKLMTRGLPMYVIVDHLLVAEETNNLLKYKAAMALAFYGEEEVNRFWQFKAKKMLDSQPLLAIPRFLALKEKDVLESLESLVYAKSTENVSRLEWNYHFEEIIEVIFQEKNQWNRLKSIYQRLPSWIQPIFDESLAASEKEYFMLRDYLSSKPSEVKNNPAKADRTSAFALAIENFGETNTEQVSSSRVIQFADYKIIRDQEIKSESFKSNSTKIYEDETIENGFKKVNDANHG